jgi:uncharacterized RDD family membrane protein YckC
METALDRREPAPAGFWIRLVAVVLDSLVILTVQFLFTLVAQHLWGVELLETTLFHGVVTLFTVVFSGAYSVVLHAHEGQTLGKMLVNVRVEQVGGRPLSKSTALWRWIASWIAAMPLLLGFVLAGLRRDKRGLHDLLAGTRVVHATP